jgi:methionyl-tRNA formyltransferase
MNIIFAGTPDFAATHLQSLLSNGHNIIAVYTQPDRPKGRGHQLCASPVKAIALEHNIPVYQPLSFKNNESAIQEIKDINADLMIVVAYGLLLPQEVINAPRLGCINVHGSLLPKWRGAAPIQRSLWAGDKETGITIMKIALALDAGDILTKASLQIDDDDTSESLYIKLAQLGSKTLCNILPNIAYLLANSQKQDENLVTYASKLSKEEALIDFTQPAHIIERYIRAYQPWPVAYFSIDGQNIKVYQAQAIANNTHSKNEFGEILSFTKSGLDIVTGDNSILRILKMQLPGKKIMNVTDIINSRKDMFASGKILNS